MNMDAAPSAPTAENNPSGEEIPLAVAEMLGRLAIAEETGELPQPASDAENFLRPERHRVNAVAPKVEGARVYRERALATGDHDLAIRATSEVLKDLDAKEFNSKHKRDMSIGATLEPVAYRRSGRSSARVRRGIDRFATKAFNMRSPEEQVEDERAIALRRVGQMVNFERHLSEVMKTDAPTAELVKSAQPAALRRHLRELADAGKLPESSPLHPRWSEAMDPKNIKGLRSYLVNTCRDVETTPKAMSLYIDSAGISGGVRPHIVAAYLGVDLEQWDYQRYGAPGKSSEKFDPEKDKNKVPSEVIDQINFLIELDGWAVGAREGENGEAVVATGLDKLIEYGAAKPWTDAPADPGHKNPMERILENREALKQTEQAELARMKAQPLLNQLNDIELVLADLPEDSREAAKLRDRKERLKRHLKKQGITTNGNGKGGEPQASAEAKRDLTEAERAQQEFLNSLSSNPVLRRLEIVNWLLKHGQDPKLADSIMARHPAPPTRPSQPSTEARHRTQATKPPSTESGRTPSEVDPKYAEYFSEGRLKELDETIADSIRDEVRHRKEGSGHEGSLPKDEFKELTQDVKESVLRHVLGSDAPEDIVHQLDNALFDLAQKRGRVPRKHRS